MEVNSDCVFTTGIHDLYLQSLTYQLSQQIVFHDRHEARVNEQVGIEIGFDHTWIQLLCEMLTQNDVQLSVVVEHVTSNLPVGGLERFSYKRAESELFFEF